MSTRETSPRSSSFWIAHALTNAAPKPHWTAVLMASTEFSSCRDTAYKYVQICAHPAFDAACGCHANSSLCLRWGIAIYGCIWFEQDSSGFWKETTCMCLDAALVACIHLHGSKAAAATDAEECQPLSCAMIIMQCLFQLASKYILLPKEKTFSSGRSKRRGLPCQQCSESRRRPAAVAWPPGSS